MSKNVEEFIIDERAQHVLDEAQILALIMKDEYLVPEHILYIMCMDDIFAEAFERVGGNIKELQNDLKNYLDENITQGATQLKQSDAYKQMIQYCGIQLVSSGRNTLRLHHIFHSIMKLDYCDGIYFMECQGVDLVQMLGILCHEDEDTDAEYDEEDTGAEYMDDDDTDKHSGLEDINDYYAYDDDDEYLPWEEVAEPPHRASTSNKKTNKNNDKSTKDATVAKKQLGKYSKYVTNINEYVKEHPCDVIGREDILNRTIQILCRRDKNNPLHIGEPGVGKTTIVHALAMKINAGEVPEELKNSIIYELDVAASVAGTEFRGDFEDRIKSICDEISKIPGAIIYLDEIHNIVGMGAMGNSSLDASNLLKPYFDKQGMRFIGSTTYEDYKKYFIKNKALVRRFQKVDVPEPTVDETVEILKGIKKYYESYHKVTYTDEALKAAVTLSKQYINDEYLPDKAIDLIDETGAYYKVQRDNMFKHDDSKATSDMEDNQLGGNQLEGKAKNNSKVIDITKAAEEKTIDNIITAEMIEATLSKMKDIPAKTVKTDEVSALKELPEKLKSKVFGQDTAIDEIVRCIKLNRAGLIEGSKPVASLLFVGPTGVGKTELAKALASELGVKLIRFDMSEYTEKHAASKLIGTPPGYVGYEEGGLLTDAIRKAPYSVLLLDEIEKAHQDIYNILLQVMDYATLTDNKGLKSDFRNVVLIMTSNAGASSLDKKLVGFGDRIADEDVINKAVKKTFTPEFRNRLNKIVRFNNITDEMASQIVDKEIGILNKSLEAKDVHVTITAAVKEYLINKGVSREYGARAIQRIIDEKIKPLFVDEILFGNLSEGGNVQVDVEGEEFSTQIR